MEAGSAAERSGLRVGDIVIGVDGTDIASVDALHQALDASRIGRDLVLKLLRAGAAAQPLFLTVRPDERAAG